MARSLSNARLFSTAVNGITSAIKRRGFSAAADGVAITGGRTNPVMTKKPVEEKTTPAHKVPWVPDPKTGYYRPDNRVEEVDVAELRAALLKHK
ncbi:hypothetical protein SAY86_017233 [Trapa natans]|uniref:Late embryogenesis abundant protein n=1 Tax=Trapa natans TaxID=22666 RepID=A0AAN7LRP6_TRANT|nr:hypothetical protein SAY86_017233 [Trapa natans]